jgi:hypothetical protein
MFRMAFTSPSTQRDGNNASTKAYAIEILTENSVQMLLTLKTILVGDDMTAFVPYSMKGKFPSAYIQAIKFQTSNLNKSRVVVLENISEDMMMFYTSLISKEYVTSFRILVSTRTGAIPS